MSLVAMTWAFQQFLDPARKIVLLALADYADDQGMCWPGQETLTAKTSLSVRSIRNQIRALEEAGLVVTVERRKEGGARATNAYILQMGGQQQPAESADSDAQPARHAESNRHAVAGIAEPSVEPSEDTPPTPSATGTAEEVAFDEAWAAWPKKADRRAAVKAWPSAAKRHPGGLPGLVADVVQHGTLHAKVTPPKFVKNLATWLNGDCWENPLPVDETRGARQAETPQPQRAVVIPPGHRPVWDDHGRIVGSEPA